MKTTIALLLGTSLALQVSQEHVSTAPFAAQPNSVLGHSIDMNVLAQRDIRQAVTVPTVDVSADGRFVALESGARLSPLDTNIVSDVYVLDRVSTSLTLESVSHDGASADGSSTRPRLSADGRYVVFESMARNLVSGFDIEVKPRVFVRDRHEATTRLVSPTPEGNAGGGNWAGGPDISDDGRFIVFEATPLTGAPAMATRAGGQEVFRFDVEENTIARMSVDSEGVELPSGSSASPSLSADGRYVAFMSTAALDREISPGRSSARQVYVRDMTGTTRLVSRSRTDRMAERSSSFPAISADGRFIAFASMASDLVGDDRNGDEDVFLRDMLSGRTVLVSRSAAGGSANGRSYHPAISGNGRFIAFVSTASDLMCARRCPVEHTDLNLVSDVYLFDRIHGTVTRVSGSQAGPGPWWEASAGPAIDFSGQVVAFSSTHATDAADLAHDFDAFIRILGSSRMPKSQDRISAIDGYPRLLTICVTSRLPSCSRPRNIAT